MTTIEDNIEIYWVRYNPEGRMTAALLEKAFTDQELTEELSDMRRHGEVSRIIASRVVIVEMMKEKPK